MQEGRSGDDPGGLLLVSYPALVLGMVSKAAVLQQVRGHRWPEVAASLTARPDLIATRDKRGRNWLHHCCMVPAVDPVTAIATADGLLALGLGLDDPAFTEGAWQATPIWHAIGHGRNLALAEHLLERGANPNFSLYAAAWNDDRAAIRLLLKHGADIEEAAGGDTSPLLGAIGWSRFGAAEELLAHRADPDALDANGRTALHLMLRKGVPAEHFAMFARAGAGTDIADPDGRTVAQILAGKRDPIWREVAASFG